MPRKSTKENKTIYQLRREELGLSREKASELLVAMPPERIEKIESEKYYPHPDEVLSMSEGYKMPELCNHYCANECPIGQRYIPQIQIKDLSQIVLGMIASLNSVQKKQERLIEITADGMIEEEEMQDFVAIQEDLEKISITVETLQLWVEKMIHDGRIDKELYCKCKDRGGKT